MNLIEVQITPELRGVLAVPNGDGPWPAVVMVHEIFGIDDAMRSRVSGTRIAISFGISSLAVYSLGPFVKASGFTQLLVAASCVAALGALIVLFLPNEAQMKPSAV